MNRILLGALGALLFVAAGLFWWAGRAAVDRAAPPSDFVVEPAPGDGESEPGADPDDLPTDHANKRGPALPEETEASKEQRAFQRYDRNRDGRITVEEMLGPRAKAFRKLDVNGDNLLSFDEWSVTTRNRFRKMDRNGDGVVSPEEHAAARRKPAKAAKCRC